VLLNLIAGAREIEAICWLWQDCASLPIACRSWHHQRCARDDTPLRLGIATPRMARVPGKPIAGSARKPVARNKEVSRRQEIFNALPHQRPAGARHHLLRAVLVVRVVRTSRRPPVALNGSQGYLRHLGVHGRCSSFPCKGFGPYR
jgi:hypothetical protein